MAMNIATMPFATNAGFKPFVKSGGAGTIGYSSSLATTSGGITLVGAAPLEAVEGNYVYGVFKFQKSSTDATQVELRDSVAVTFTFDGISSEDWDAGSFQYAVIDSTGALVNSANDYRAPYTSGDTSIAASTSPWSTVSTDNAANSGTIYFNDASPFNPFSGTGAYGVVLAVKVKTDALVESGEFVKFKLTQDTASGTAFTQSNYTETTISIKDYLGANGSTGVAAGLTGRFDTTGSIPYIRADNGTVTSGTDNVIDTFTFGGTFIGQDNDQANWNVSQGANDNLISHYFVVNNFDREDVMKIDFQGSKPGLSITTINADSAGFANEAFFLNALRSVNGLQVNNGGVYLFEVNNSTQYVNGTSNAAVTGSGVSTYVFVDTNRNGAADTIDTDSLTTASSDGDLLIRLSGVSVGDIQSTNFLFTV